MNAMTPAFAHLFVLLAREAPVGVIFRRGPRDWTQIIHWDTKKDIFTPGQWFHGRLYSKRSDLSPDGKLLIYFAAKYHRLNNPPHSYRIWTAISKPPYFTGLFFAPDFDTYGGGGIFIDNHTVLYNNTSPFDGVQEKPQPKLTVISKRECFSATALAYHRLLANGWTWPENDAYAKSEFTIKSLFSEEILPSSIFVKGIEPLVWHKQVGHYTLTLTYKSTASRYQLTHTAKGYFTFLDKVEWADFDYRGRVVLAKEGKLFAAIMNHQGLGLTELADFNANQPEAIESPEWAKKW
jgi:hypothetical protein